MIIYKATKKEFLKDFKTEQLVGKIEKSYEEKIQKASYTVVNSWNGSLPYLYMVLEDDKIPDTCGISIEHKIPNLDIRKKCIDVILTGIGKHKEKVAIILELKQWSKVKQPSDKVGYITFNQKEKKKGRPHPSYQAWSYAYLLKRYNNAIISHNIQVDSCAFLHNYDKQEEDDLLFDTKYQKWIEKSPLFVRGEVANLRKFITDRISHGDSGKIIDLIDKSPVSICRLLEMEKMDMLEKAEKNADNFVLIDEQELIYEKAMYMAEQCRKDNQKRVLLVKGGPGTGKSVLAMKLLVDLVTNPQSKIQKVNYITPIQGQRGVYQHIVGKDKAFRPIVKKIKSSGSFIGAEPNENDVLIVDEAHRLKEKSGQYQTKGENQTKEIIRASKLSIFFIDDLQRVTVRDKGSIEEIIKRAQEQNARIEEMELTSQFRCQGSSSYIAWIEDVLELRSTANYDGFDKTLNYDVRVVDTPNKVREVIENKNKKNNASRIVAGYCWDSKKEARDNPYIYDIQIPKYKFEMSWNLQREKWAIAKDSVERAGCIYTCQGFDFEYIGVIIGKDLIYRDGKVQTDYKAKAKTDSALTGIKGIINKDEQARKLADTIIKSTYRILLTRGQAGCVIYCEDEPLRDYLKKRLNF